MGGGQKQGRGGRGVARGSWGARDPLGRPSFEQTTFRWRKRHDNYLGRKSHCSKAHYFKICFFVKYFRQRLLSLVNMGLHTAIIQLSPLIREGGKRYKPYIVGERFSGSRNSVPVHSNDDHSDEVFVCPETTKHHNCRNVTVTFIRLTPKLAL